MKAMILSAGFGTRLGALTKTTPKCLVEAGGKPMLEHAVNRLARSGVNQILVNTHYLPEQVVEYLTRNPKLPVDVQLIHEPELLGTGGAIKNAEKFFSSDSSFLVMNVDVYFEFDLHPLIAAHNLGHVIATLAVQNRQESTYLLIGNTGKMVGTFSGEKENIVVPNILEPKKTAFCCVQIISNEIFEIFKLQGTEFSIIETYLLALKHGHIVNTVNFDGKYWIDMGSHKKLEELNQHLANLSQSFSL